MPANFGQYVDLGSRAIIGNFYRRYEMDLAGSWASRISFMNDKTNQSSETYKFLGAPPFPREWTGGRQEKGMKLYSLTIDNKKYESTLNVNEDDLRRDKTGQVLARVGEFAAGFADHWNSLVTTLITSNATTGVYDGQNFFDTDHSIENSGTIINNVAAAQVPALNVTTAAAPTQSEMSNAIMGCIQWMYGFKDENANPVHGTARQFGVMVPVNLMGAAMAGVMSDRLEAGNANPLKSQMFSVEVLPNPRLTSTTEFYIFRLDGPSKAFILQDETGVEIEVLGSGSDHKFKTGDYLFGGKANRGAGYGEWLYALKATLS